MLGMPFLRFARLATPALAGVYQERVHVLNAIRPTERHIPRLTVCSEIRARNPLETNRAAKRRHQCALFLDLF